MKPQRAAVVPISSTVDVVADDEERAMLQADLQRMGDELYALALHGAPHAYQVQLMREMAVIQMRLAVGRRAIGAVAALAADAQRHGTQVATMTAVYANGMRDFVDPELIEDVIEMGRIGLEQIKQTQIAAGNQLIDQVDGFKAPSTQTSRGDVVWHGVRGTLPAQMVRRRQGGW